MEKVLLIINGLNYEGVSNVTMTYLESFFEYKKEVILGITGSVVDSYLLRLKNNSINFVIFPNRNLDTFSYLKELYIYIKRNNIKTIHVNGNSSTIAIDLFVGMLAGCKKRIGHSHNTQCDHILLNRLLKPLLKFTCNERLACGKSAGEWLFKDKKFFVLPNAIKTNKFKFNNEYRERIRNELEINNTFLIGHVGVFNNQKNQIYLVRLAKQLIKNKFYNFQFLLIGTGDNYEFVKSLAIENGVDRYFIFYGLTDKIEEVYSAMDLFVLPSLHEGLPCVLVEAQASGLHCIVSDSVSKESNICGCIKFHPLEHIGDWANEIMNYTQYDRERDSNEFVKILKDQNYDIDEAASKLISIYKGDKK